jgi:hypothetical protein
MSQTLSRMKRKIPVLQVNVADNALYKQLVHHPDIKEIVIEALIEAVADGLNSKKKSVPLFEVADCEYYIELEKDKWKPSLEMAIEYYAEKEDYDACACCRDLINKISYER